MTEPLPDRIDVVVVGGGQAGIAASEHLGSRGIPHVVLERDRIAERWRTGRWDSLVTNGPAWHDCFPGSPMDGVDPDGFPPKDQVAGYFASYADRINAPVHEGVEVTSARRREGDRGFHLETTAGPIDAEYVVVATGPFQVPVMPSLVPADAPVLQIHSNDYRNPEQLPDGGVLVVGCGASGVQIADELCRAGRPVHLAIGRHARPPRRYRGRDIVWWLGALGLWDMQAPAEGAEHVTIAFSGAYGGRTVDFRTLAAEGIALHGRVTGYSEGVVHFGGDIAKDIAEGDEVYLDLLDQADAFAERNGLGLPEDSGAREIGPLPACATDPVLELDLAAAGMSTIIWATGFRTDYGWLQVDSFDDAGKPMHQRGVASEPGLYFLGLPWLSNRGSSFIWGVWHDAGFVVDHIFNQRHYFAHGASPTRP
jgi:putative flavoprotein involved in K+ transport